MIGRDQDAPLIIGAENFSDRPDDVGINPLEGLDLGGVPALVAGFVGSLDMNADDVVLVESFDGVCALGSIVGVEVTVVALGHRPASSSASTATPHQVDSPAR